MTYDELFFNDDVNSDLLDDDWFASHNLVNDFGKWIVVNNKEVQENARQEQSKIETQKGA